MSPAERAKRDARILDLFLGGATYRQIAGEVGLRSPQSVHNIVTRELKKGAERRGVLTDQAIDVYVERTEALLRANMPAALRGDYKAAVICDRMLARQARLFGNDTAGGALPPRDHPDGPLGDDDDEEGGDELAKFRRRRTRSA